MTIQQNALLLLGAVAFWVTTGQQMFTGPLGFSEKRTDNGNNFDLGTDRFTSPSTSKYFIAMSAVADTSQSLRLETTNTNPQLNMYTLDTVHNAPIHISVDAIVEANAGASVGVRVQGGRTFNGASLSKTDLTSFAMFNLDNAMTQPNYFYVDRDTPTTIRREDLRFPNIHTSATQLTADSKYVCDRSGTMFLFISVGAQKPARVELAQIRNNNRIGYELMDRDTIDEQQNIVSRSVMINCEPNDSLNVHSYADDGTYSGSDIKTSFGGFFYTPRHGNPIAWAAYRYVNVATNPSGSEYRVVTFRNVVINQQQEAEVEVNQPSGVFSQASSRFTAPRSGIYLVHFTASIIPGSTTDVALFKNSEKVASIYDTYTGHDNKVTVSRTVLIQVNNGESLDIRVHRNVELGSHQSSKDIAFMGMLIHEN